MPFIVLAVLLSAAALLAVVYPLLAHAHAATPAAGAAQETLDELLGQRDATLQALRELNFDHNLGKIGDEDFAAFEANLKQLAADSLRALDRWEAEADDELDAALEKMVGARKLALAAGGRVCPSCGRAVAADEKFCASCGAALREAVAAAGQACPKCGRAYEPGDRFWLRRGAAARPLRNGCGRELG